MIYKDLISGSINLYKTNHDHRYSRGFHSRRCLAYLIALLVLLLIALSVKASATAPAVAWDKVYAIGNWSEGRLVISTGDGYLLAGSSDSAHKWLDSVGGDDVFLIKTDLGGNEVWNLTYDGPNRDYWGSIRILSMIAVSDGYVVTGTRPYGIGKPLRAYLTKIDRDGHIIWSKNHNNSSAGNAVVPADGGYIVAGYSGGLGAIGMFDSGLLIRTDLDGHEIWHRTYLAPGAGDRVKDRGSNWSLILSIPIPDGWFNAVLAPGDGYVLAGQANDSAWLVKTDLEGNETWNRTYGRGTIYAIVNASDGYVFLDSTRLVKTDLDGDVIWMHELVDYFPGPQAGSLSGLLVAVPGGYVMAGQINASDNKSKQAYLVKTDLGGNLTWNATYAMAGDNYVNGLIVDQGAYVIAGNSMVNFTDYYGTPWLLKTHPDDSGAMPVTPATSQVLTTLAIIFAAIAVRSRNKQV